MPATNPKPEKNEQKNIQEFILFIPGFETKQEKESLKILIKGIEKYCYRNGLYFNQLSGTNIQGAEQSHIKVGRNEYNAKLIDIKEVNWRDLCTNISSEKGIIQVMRGLEMLLFWIKSPELWKQIFSSKYILFWTIATLIVSIAWYYSILATTFIAIGTNPEILSLELPPNISNFFKTLGENMGGWNALVITSILISILPVKEVIDISYSTKCYLENYKNTKRKILARADKAIELVNKPLENNPDNRHNYDRVTVLSHSFGTVISTELLAKYEGETCINNITLGGALLIITARSKKVKKAVDDMLKNKKIKSWIDFYSDNDWLCTKSPVTKNIDNYQSRKITSTVAFDEKFNGTSHALYFDDDDVIATLLGSLSGVENSERA